MKLKPAFPDAYLNLGNVYKVCLRIMCEDMFRAIMFSGQQ